MAQQQFDVSAIQPGFWSSNEVRSALAQRDIGALLRTFLERHPSCSQTRLALMVEHDRSEVSNWVRGTRRGRVSDIDVLCRIADGLAMPDASRVLLGLAPQDSPISQFCQTPGMAPEADRLRVSLCGSRSGDTDIAVLEAVIPGLARQILLQSWSVTHGPVGVGIETMTYLADHYHPPGTHAAIGTLGHHNVIAPAAYILVIGGGTGTAIELDLAVSMGKRVLPLACSGGAAARFAAESRHSPSLRWLRDSDFHTLCETTALTYPEIVRELITAAEGVRL